MICKVLSNSKSAIALKYLFKNKSIFFSHEVLYIPRAINFDEVSKEVCFQKQL